MVFIDYTSVCGFPGSFIVCVSDTCSFKIMMEYKKIVVIIKYTSIYKFLCYLTVYIDVFWWLGLLSMNIKHVLLEENKGYAFHSNSNTPYLRYRHEWKKSKMYLICYLFLYQALLYQLERFSTMETFPQYFLEMLNSTLQNFTKIMKKCFSDSR